MNGCIAGDFGQVLRRAAALFRHCDVRAVRHVLESRIAPIDQRKLADADADDRSNSGRCAERHAIRDDERVMLRPHDRAGTMPAQHNGPSVRALAIEMDAPVVDDVDLFLIAEADVVGSRPDVDIRQDAGGNLFDRRLDRQARRARRARVEVAAVLGNEEFRCLRPCLL